MTEIVLTGPGRPLEPISDILILLTLAAVAAAYLAMEYGVIRFVERFFDRTGGGVRPATTRRANARARARR